MSKHIFLLGFMGSGKSFWGAKLAAQQGVPLVDLDRWIEEKEGQTIAELFAGAGETGFRALEQQYLHGLAGLPPAVISLGGGTPCFFDNLAWINQHGHSVYLEVPLDLLLERLRRKPTRRPLLAQLPPEEWPAFLEKMLAKRRPFYRQAHQTIAYTGDEEAFFAQLCAAAE